MKITLHSRNAYLCFSDFTKYEQCLRHTNAILQLHPVNPIPYPYNRPDTCPRRRSDQDPALRAGLAPCPGGQVRDPAFRAGKIPCPGGRSDNLS